MVIQGLLFQRNAASDFYRLGKVRLCEQRELCMRNIRSTEIRPGSTGTRDKAREFGGASLGHCSA